MGEMSLWMRFRAWLAGKIYPEIFEWYYGRDES